SVVVEGRRISSGKFSRCDDIFSKAVMGAIGGDCLTSVMSLVSVKFRMRSMFGGRFSSTAAFNSSLIRGMRGSPVDDVTQRSRRWCWWCCERPCVGCMCRLRNGRGWR
ncbi:unnamed protein product, partial [Choristocarpus tenellus]